MVQEQDSKLVLVRNRQVQVRNKPVQVRNSLGLARHTDPGNRQNFS